MTTPTYGDEPAFPQVGSIGGLSKREYFAGLAMQGLLPTSNKQEPGWADIVSQAAVIIADTLLDELSKPRGEG